MRFSLLYIGGEGVATFDALYIGNNAIPQILALINSDGFSGNWTSFRDETEIFGRMVLNNPNGIPKYLLCGGCVTGDPPRLYADWSTYTKLILTIRETLGLWEREP